MTRHTVFPDSHACASALTPAVFVVLRLSVAAKGILQNVRIPV